MLTNFHMCGIMLLLIAVLKLLMRAYVFNVPHVYLSGPCCYFSFVIYYLLDSSCGECNVVSLYCIYSSVNGSVCHVCGVFVKVW